MTHTTVELVPGAAVHGQVRPPGSKSLTNRALICAAMATGPSRLQGALKSEDTEVMIQGLRQIGAEIQVKEGGETLIVQGLSGQPKASSANVFIANSGTTIRFLTAVLAAAGGSYRLTGVPRMHQRPIGDLLEGMRPVLDGTVHAESPGDCPPVAIDSRGWRGGNVRVGGSVSSQYLSGLLMAAPLARDSIQIEVVGELVSQPYVRMTQEVMSAFGVPVSTSPHDGKHRFSIKAPLTFKGTEYAIEPDASAASYFWAAAAISGGTVTVQGLSSDALQGDVAFVDVLRRMGCGVVDDGHSITVTGAALRGIDVDMNAISDTVQTLAVVALFAKGRTTIRGVAHNRFKETDRIGDLARELNKLGATVTETDDGLQIDPPANLEAGFPEPVLLETYHDHRMAMSLSLVGLRVGRVQISNPSCTAKTYPGFFRDLEQLTGRTHHWRSKE